MNNPPVNFFTDVCDLWVFLNCVTLWKKQPINFCRIYIICDLPWTVQLWNSQAVDSYQMYGTRGFLWYIQNYETTYHWILTIYTWSVGVLGLCKFTEPSTNRFSSHINDLSHLGLSSYVTTHYQILSRPMESFAQWRILEQPISGALWHNIYK
jgi:hypothetical protein